MRAASTSRARIGVGLRVELADALLSDPSPPVDFVEIHPENFVRRGGAHASMLAAAQARFPVLTHGLTMGFADLEPPPAEEVAALSALVRRVGATLHSDHFAITRRRGRIIHDLLPPPFESETLEVAVERLCRLRDALGVEVAVENLSYYIPRVHDPRVEAELLAELLERADARLLLDLNNVVVNAHNHGFEPRDFLARLPLARVAAIHVAGHAVRGDGLRIDTHAEAVSDEVFAWLPEVLSVTGDVPIVLERDGQFPAWADLRAELMRLRAAAEEGLARHAARTAGAASTPEAPYACGPAPARSPRALGRAHERLGEPAAHDALHDATFAYLLDANPRPLGDARTAPRYALQRTMVRGRLRSLMLGALPRLTRSLGDDTLAAALDDHLAANGPRDAVFHALVQSFGAWLGGRLADDHAALLWLDLAEWSVRQEPAPPPEPVAPALDFTQRAVLAPARRAADLGFRVHDALPAQARPEPFACHVVVFLDARDVPVVLALDPVGATLLATLADAPSVAVALQRTAATHALANTKLVLDGVVEVLGHWLTLGLLRGTAATTRHAS